MSCTSVLYVSHVDLSFLFWGGVDRVGRQALPDLTWAALRHVPAEFLGMGALMTGLWWIIDRRSRVKEEEEPSSGAPPKKGEGDE